MNLKELQAVLDDRLMMHRIYDALLNCARLKQGACKFLHTDDYPNRHNSVINKEQIAQLEADGYTVVDVSNGSQGVHYIVSGWTLQLTR